MTVRQKEDSTDLKHESIANETQHIASKKSIFAYCMILNRQLRKKRDVRMFSKIQINVFTCRNRLLKNQLSNNIRLHETSFNPQDCFGTSQTCSVHLFTAVMHRFVCICR